MRLLHILALPATAFAVHLSPLLTVQDPSQHLLNRDDVKVPVQLGVMSRCPDALLCENTFNQVIPKVENKVDLSMVYLAKFVDISMCAVLSHKYYFKQTGPIGTGLWRKVYARA